MIRNTPSAEAQTLAVSPNKGRDILARTAQFARQNPGLLLAVGMVALMGSMDAMAGNVDPFDKANTVLNTICTKMQGAWVKVLAIVIVIIGAVMHMAQNRKGMGIAIGGCIGLLLVLAAPGVIVMIDATAKCQ